MIDLDDPVHAGALLMLIVAGLVIAIAMDMRRLPLGRIKWVPWTMLTLALFMAAIYAARQLLIDLVR